MSKINAVRLINVNYNNNAIRISDECFHLNGESTLLSLRNGGGKSVLVQMMTAPFVISVTGTRRTGLLRGILPAPTLLYSGGMGSGSGGRICHDRHDGAQASGDFRRGDRFPAKSWIWSTSSVNIQSGAYRISAILPVVEKAKKEITLKSFGACRQLFESCKRVARQFLLL